MTFFTYHRRTTPATIRQKSIQPLDDSNEYLLRSPVEINFVLSGLARNTQPFRPITARRQILRRYRLSGRPRERFLYIDPSPDATANQQLLGSSQIIMSPPHDKVKVQFDLAGLVSVTHEADRHRTSIPERLLKLQRRHYYRLSVPPDNQTIKCTIPLPEQAPIESRSWTSASEELASSATPPMSISPQEKCTKTAPSACRFRADYYRLADPHLLRFCPAQWALTQQAGCLFLNLSKQAEPLIQRYILEQERKVPIPPDKR